MERCQLTMAVSRLQTAERGNNEVFCNLSNRSFDSRFFGRSIFESHAGRGLRRRTGRVFTGKHKYFSNRHRHRCVVAGNKREGRIEKGSIGFILIPGYILQTYRMSKTNRFCRMAANFSRYLTALSSLHFDVPHLQQD